MDCEGGQRDGESNFYLVASGKHRGRAGEDRLKRMGPAIVSSIRRRG